MDINTMPAGPEMDALVAEKVMGWERIDGDIGTIWSLDCKAHDFDEVPKYSSDIAAAWEVVEKMRPRWKQFRLSYGPHLVVEGKPKDGWELEPAWCSPICGFGETAPLAICRAAIKACIPSGE